MPNTIEEIYEIFEKARKIKRDVDHLDRELAECQGQLAHVEDDLAQSQDDLEEARSRQTVPDENAEAQRVHEMELLDKRMRMEELRLTTAQLETKILKAQSEGGGGSDKSWREADPEVHLLTTTKKDDFVVKSAKN